ncbi:MAG: cyclase family protein [Pseudomonadota bacterium]
MTPHFPYTLIDLTHSLSPEIPTWDGSCGFDHQCCYDYEPAAEYQFRLHKIAMNEGIGTHMDSPAHCFANGMTIDQLPLAGLISPCIVIDISTVAHERTKVSVQDIENFEKEHGTIPHGSFAMIKTGWERFWATPEKYHNNHLFPSVSREAAAFLLDRGITGLGIDTLSADHGDEGFPVHKLVLGTGKYLVENAANLDALSPRDDFIMIVPMKIKNGTEAPIRLIGLRKK